MVTSKILCQSLCEDTEFIITFHRKDTLAAAIGNQIMLFLCMDRIFDYVVYIVHVARHLSPGSLQSGKTLRNHQQTPPTSMTQTTALATPTPSTNHTPSLEEATPTVTPLLLGMTSYAQETLCTEHVQVPPLPVSMS